VIFAPDAVAAAAEMSRVVTTATVRLARP
jgi:hypothetical protein